MEMMQFLEADKEQLMSGLAAAGTPEKAQSVLEKEFDRLLLRYNEECIRDPGPEADLSLPSPLSHVWLRARYFLWDPSSDRRSLRQTDSQCLRFWEEFRHLFWEASCSFLPEDCQ